MNSREQLEKRAEKLREYCERLEAATQAAPAGEQRDELQRRKSSAAEMLREMTDTLTDETVWG